MPDYSLSIVYVPQMIAQGYASTTLAALFCLLNLSLQPYPVAIVSQNLSWMAISGCALIFLAIIIADVLPAHWFGRKKVE